MECFPFCIDIENKKCIVVGGGKVALRKIEKLSAFKPKITVIAPEICKKIYSFPNIKIHNRKFTENDLDGAFIVISATDDLQLNENIFRLCSEKGILVNTVDDRNKCSFIFPAIVKKENVVIGISTSGKSPIYSRYLRESIENGIDDNCDRIIDILNSCRSAVKNQIPLEENRKLAFEKLLKICTDDIESINKEKIMSVIEEYK